MLDEFNEIKESQKEMKETMKELLQAVKNNQSEPSKSNSILSNHVPLNISVTNADMSTNYNSMYNTNVMKTSNVMKHITTNYNNVKPLEMLEPAQAKKLVTDKNTKKHKVEELLVYYYDKKSFSAFIGDIIINAYKKNNPEEQQIWASDVERLTFIIRRALEENELLWMKDLKGITITKYLIIPILNEVYMMIEKYRSECGEKVNDPVTSFDDMDKYYEYSVLCKKILSDIGNKFFHEPILKYIIANFQLHLNNSQLAIKGSLDSHLEGQNKLSLLNQPL